MKTLVSSVVNKTAVFDIHTHIYDANFGKLLLWGIDELLTYHYLVAEVFRVAPITYEKFWTMSTKEQADYIWQKLFLERSPMSEACRGILTCIHALGFDPAERNLNKYRAFFRDMKVSDYIDLVFSKANVSRVIMTNDPFDNHERSKWKKSMKRDDRFVAALRIDKLLVDWYDACGTLSSWGYEVEPRLGNWTQREIRRFLNDWAKTMKPAYMAASLPPTFTYPEDSACGKIIENCILPVGKDLNLPFAMMIGVKKLVNPDLKLAGDSVGKADISVIEKMCSTHSENKFLVTMLSRENQHELCVTARKFPNLMIFGCWWFLNNPSIIREMTSERIELLGLSMIPQHSDARVLDQLIYKWKHSREVIAEVLTEKYTDLDKIGWNIREEDIKRDVEILFGKMFMDFTV
ncbi:MAG: glucuronate isomerase [Candidatus Latescibacteria bacterium]|nr:glucuronate isomerase [Candidatus Latescibacterota bacterium]